MSGATATLQAALPPRALNAEGGAPEWIELIPAGAVVTGHDGRGWANPDPDAVVSATRAANRPLPLDWEHATQKRGEVGEEAPAAGWIGELDVREGAIWGRVEWTPRAQNQVRDREYRFVSPVFNYERAAPHRITKLVGAGLTNAPNLQLRALNRAGDPPHHQENDVAFIDQVREAMGLPATADEAAVLAAARTATAANRAGPDLAVYAPRSELMALNTRALAAEGALKVRDEADRTAAIETALNRAQGAGKVTPASRAGFLAMCQAEGGLERFVELEKTLPVLTGEQTRTGAKPAPAADGPALTDVELAVCRATGRDPVEFAAAKKEG